MTTPPPPYTPLPRRRSRMGQMNRIFPPFPTTHTHKSWLRPGKHMVLLEILTLLLLPNSYKDIMLCQPWIPRQKGPAIKWIGTTTGKPFTWNPKTTQAAKQMQTRSSLYMFVNSGLTTEFTTKVLLTTTQKYCNLLPKWIHSTKVLLTTTQNIAIYYQNGNIVWFQALSHLRSKISILSSF